MFVFKLCIQLSTYLRLPPDERNSWEWRGDVYIIWTDDNSLRSLYRWNTRAWRPGFRSLIQLNRFARNGLRSISTAGPREGEGAKGRYHTVATVFFTSRKRASKLRPGPRLTGNGSLRVRSGRVSSSLLFSIYIYSFERGMDFNFKTKRMANEWCCDLRNGIGGEDGFRMIEGGFKLVWRLERRLEKQEVGTVTNRLGEA